MNKYVERYLNAHHDIACEQRSKSTGKQVEEGEKFVNMLTYALNETKHVSDEDKAYLINGLTLSTGEDAATRDGYLDKLCDLYNDKEAMPDVDVLFASRSELKTSQISFKLNSLAIKRLVKFDDDDVTSKLDTYLEELGDDLSSGHFMVLNNYLNEIVGDMGKEAQLKDALDTLRVADLIREHYAPLIVSPEGKAHIANLVDTLRESEDVVLLADTMMQTP